MYLIQPELTSAMWMKPSLLSYSSRVTKAPKFFTFVTVQTTSSPSSGHSYAWRAVFASAITRGPQDLASDRGLPARRLRDRGAADLAQHRAGGAVEDDLLVAAILALDPEEPARGLRDHLCTSTSSNFFARMPGRWWAFLHSRQRKRRWIFFVGFSRPSGFGRGKPPYPAVTRRNRRWPARSSDRGRFFTRSTSSSTCLLQKGQ